MNRDVLVPLVLELDGEPPFLLLDVLRRHLKATIAAAAAELWLADYEEQDLARLEAGPQRHPLLCPIDDGNLRGQAYRQQRILTESLGDGTFVAYVPVGIRAERLGVLDVFVLDAPTDDIVDYMRALGSSLGYVLLAARRYTDLFEAVRRRKALELPAEMQWDLLPVLAHDGPNFSIAGRLEPAYDIGGDNFDYAVDADGISVAVTDAMGHGTRAALLSTLVVGVQRNTRRHGDGLRQQARAVNTVVHDQFDGEAYATGLMLRLRRSDGALSVVNGGHGPIYVLRDGSVERITFEPDLPFGLFPESDYHVHERTVQPGDRLIVVSDGILEAAPERGDAFGEEKLTQAVLDTADLPPPEMVRQLTARCMAYRVGYLLDDATAVCIDYRR